MTDDATAQHIRDQGGQVWVWLDTHPFPGGGYQDLLAATEVPGSGRATRRYRSARRRHRFSPYPGEGFEVLFDYGGLEPPEELHLALKRFPKGRVAAFWNGARFAGQDIPPPDEWGGEVPGRHRPA